MASRTKTTGKTIAKAKSKMVAKPRAIAKPKASVKPKPKARLKAVTKKPPTVKNTATTTAKSKRLANNARPSKPVAKKPAQKNPVSNKPAVKKAVTRPPAQKTAKRETLAELRAHVDQIETRLGHADKLTKSSVRALKSSFNKLSERTSRDHQEHLTTHIEALSDRLTGLIEKTREDVAHDLQIVLQDPRLETVGTALTNANHRISCAEAEQAAAIRSINEQIAKLATVVDQRLQSETRARELASELLAKKIEKVEQGGAQAVTEIGDKIVALNEEMTRRAATRANDLKTELKQEFSEQGLTQQQEFEEHKSEISNRIEALEDDQRNTIPSIERRMVTLASRLDTLETERFTPPSLPDYAEPPQAIASPAIPDAFSPHAPVSAQPVALPVELTTQPALEISAVPTAYAAPAQSGQEVIPQEYASQNPNQNAQIAPAALPQENTLQEYTPPENAAESHIPREYVPQEYEAPVAAATPYQQPAPAHAPFNYETGSFEQMAAPDMQMPPMMDAGMPPIPGQPLNQMPEMQTPAPQMPGDPYLAGAPEQTLDAVRPGGDIIPQKKRKLLGFLKRTAASDTAKSSPVKLFALMAGIAVIGLFAAQRFMSSGADSAQNIAPEISQAQAVDNTLNNDTPEFVETLDTDAPSQPVESLEVVGDYSDSMQAPELEPSANGAPSAQQLTLEASAASGDMVAQFQMGLAHLEAGRTQEAVRLIRLSANQGQPAAQYRLAKLYESGVGVEKDLPTAMKLLDRSAKAGNRIAMHDLGHYFATGTALEKPDIAEAVNWFQQAANRGVLDSQFNLGVLYHEGSGVERNEVEAYIWYSVAGAQGDRMAVQRAEVIARDLAEPQLDQAKSRVKAFTPMRINDQANGVFKNTPWASSKKPKDTAQMSPGVQDTQRMLASLGYEIGAPDGAMGPRTRNAIINFERANGLPETGRISSELVDRLSLAVGA
jgi:localization factor PodJL